MEIFSSIDFVGIESIDWRVINEIIANVPEIHFVSFYFQRENNRTDRKMRTCAKDHIDENRK